MNIGSIFNYWIIGQQKTSYFVLQVLSPNLLLTKTTACSQVLMVKVKDTSFQPIKNDLINVVTIFKNTYL